jgi:DNA modification methylase
MKKEMTIRCTFKKLVSISELKSHPKNRNKHSKEQIQRLAKILEYQGFRYPIKVSNRSGFVTSGHGRIEASKLNKWLDVPVDYQDYESEEQEYADVQADNAIASWAELDLSEINADLGDLGPDFDIDYLGINNFEIEVADKGLCDEDEVPEHVEPKTKLGDIYQLGNHRLMCGDSTSIDAVEKLMDGEKPELCFTSPPYADQRDYCGGLELSTEHMATFIRAAFSHVKYFAVNLGYSRKNGQVNPYWNDYVSEAKNCGLNLLSWNVWDKGQCGSIGNQNAMFGISHEWVFVFGIAIKELNRTVENSSYGEKTNRTGNRQKDGSIKKGKAGVVGQYSQLKTVLSLSPQMAQADIEHPARFPVEFPCAYIEAMTAAGDIVYEPFGGSGSTLIACEKTNRKCFMMEIGPHYCDVIVARWEKYTGKNAILLSGAIQDGKNT